MRNCVWLLLLLIFISSTQASITSVLVPKEEKVYEQWSLDDKIGQLLIVGYHHDRQIRQVKPGGIILYGKTVKQGAKAAGHLIHKIKMNTSKHLKQALFVSIDQEGGKVLRLKEGITEFPDAAAIGALHSKNIAYKVGQVMGSELRAIGINMNMAPVIELSNPFSFLENRTWSPNKKNVALLTHSYIKGMQQQGVMAVAKHYPSHGGTSTNGHFKLPRVDKNPNDFWREDMAPFRFLIKRNLKALMSAHVLLPQIDPSNPASLSKIFLEGLLRDKLNFQGLIISDDLGMSALDEQHSTTSDMAMKAFKAGSDMLLFAYSIREQKRFIRKMKSAISSGEISMQRVHESLDRIISAKKALFSKPKASKPNVKSARLANFVAREAIKWKFGKKELLERKTRSNWSKKWLVYSPTNISRRVWLKKRPQDHVIVYKRLSARNLKKSLAIADKQLRNVVIITKPYSSMRKSLQWEFLDYWNQRKTKVENQKFTLWVHQGIFPGKILGEAPGEDSNLAWVNLHSESHLSMSALLTKLKL